MIKLGDTGKMNRDVVENRYEIKRKMDNFQDFALLFCQKIHDQKFICRGTSNQTAECRAPIQHVRQYLEKSTCLVIIIS